MITRRAPLTAKVQWFLSVCFACLACLAGLLSLHAAEFTTPITISETDTTYDSQDIVINNTTVTIDGTHSFNSLLLTNNAVLTHSACTTPRRINTISATLASGTGTVFSLLESTERSF